MDSLVPLGRRHDLTCPSTYIHVSPIHFPIHSVPRVLVELDFGRDELRLSVSDDGVGLPDDYEGRGHGFANMRAYAGRLGGRLIVEPTGPAGGASVTCVMPLSGGGKEG